MAHYRILTFNAAFLPRTPFSPALPDHAYRVDRISEILIRDDVDIVVLNELFVPEIRARFIRSLDNTHRVPGWMDNRALSYQHIAAAPRTASKWISPDRLRAPSATDSLGQEAITKRPHRDGTSRTRRHAISEPWQDVPLVNSGLLFAYRRNRGLICPDPPRFVPWACRGAESITARMGFFHIKIGLRDAETPASIQLVGLHLNPYSRHSDIRAAQLNELSSFIHRQDDGVFAPLLRLVVGDFNIVGDSAEYRATLGSGRLPYSCDLYRAHHPADPGYTWSAENPLTAFALRDASTNERLDYMFLVQHPRCRKRLVVNSIEIARFSIDDYEYEFASDHFGLLLDCDIGCL